MHQHTKSIALATAVCMMSAVSFAADPPNLRVPLIAASLRQPAPALSLQDAAGKTVHLADYRGKVILLDFWATWCHGCKTEIPWFSAFSNSYRDKGLVVIGVSLDDDGWKTLRPFLDANPIPYPIVLGDEATAKTFTIEAMPDTFLIDRKGKIAAIYRGGLVDQRDVDTHLKTLLSAR